MAAMEKNLLVDVLHDLRRLFPDRRGRSRLDQKRRDADAEPGGVEPAPRIFPRRRKLRQVVGCVQRCSSFSFPMQKADARFRRLLATRFSFYMLLSIFSIAYMDLRRKSKTVPMLCQYCGVFSLLAVTASYRQVKLLRRLDVLLLLSSRILRFCAQNISGRFLKQIVSKLNHAQIEMYFRSDFCNYTQFSLLNTVLYLT